MNKRKKGTEKEELAADWMTAHGYQILERNYRCRQGEIDLIGEKDGVLVFVEVKYRKDSRLGDPAEAVDLRKQHRIARTAEYYCWEKGRWNCPCRFDVIRILGAELEYIENAFAYR